MNWYIRKKPEYGKSEENSQTNIVEENSQTNIV